MIAFKTTINGFRYDTTNAELLGEARHATIGSPSHWRAALYRTPRANRCFLVGMGGSMTVFAEQVRLIPLSEHEARKWAMDHLTAAEVEAAFPELAG